MIAPNDDIEAEFFRRVRARNQREPASPPPLSMGGQGREGSHEGDARRAVWIFFGALGAGLYLLLRALGL